MQSRSATSLFIRRRFSFVGLLLSAAAFAADVPTQLAADGKTTFVIVTATEPTLEEQTAATWFSETLEQVTGAKLPIRAATKNDASDVKPHEIRVRFRKRRAAR